MIYKNTKKGIFLSRPNRFIAHVEIDSKTEIVHVKNTGRCRELLICGSEVIVEEVSKPSRSTNWDLISVWKGNRLINMDSQAPNKVVAEWLKTGSFLPDISKISPETRFGSSRLDFYVEAGSRKIWIEVKGVTLEEDGVVLFPDAPTVRGVKHLNELSGCIQSGYESMAIFVVQMENVLYFTPNQKTHPEFGAALRLASEAGVTILALDCLVEEDRIEANHFVPVHLP
jgi:sugar fermentation stimulation protein A